MGREEGSRVVILGSGSSTGVPSPSCVLSHSGGCSVCAEGMRHGRASPNYRLNPSLLVIREHPHFSNPAVVQIDCTKQFKEQVLFGWRTANVSHMDALVLTHTHADAVFGLDDLRSVQGNWWEGNHSNCGAMPVHLSYRDMEEARVKFDYLMPRPPENGEADVHRMVSSIDWNVFPSDECGSTIHPASIEMELLPVLHGGDYVAFGFLFGVNERCCYLSDVKSVPDDVMRRLESEPTLDLLIIDSLFKSKRHNTHFCMEEALQLIRRLRPNKSLLTGLTHAFDHMSDNAELAKLHHIEGLDVQLACDGLSIPLDL